MYICIYIVAFLVLYMLFDSGGVYSPDCITFTYHITYMVYHCQNIENIIR